MIYVTGDMHGDISRFKSKEMKKLKKQDILIICGDFGFIWDGSKREQKLLKWIGKRKYQVLFVEGTHENLDLLGQYPAEEWNGGITRQISGNLRHLCRGHIFSLEGMSIFAFGGGASEDSDSRVHADTWWSGELPTPQEVEEARCRLLEAGNEVDFIVTHQPSYRLRKLMSADGGDCTLLDLFLDEVRNTCKFKRWAFGSTHTDKVIPPSEVAVFRQVRPLS